MSSDAPQRLIDVFPPGFDSRLSSNFSSRGPYIYAPEQLYRTLTSDYNPTKHIEWTYVESVWYGKQEKSARHEFILVVFCDAEAGLRNYLVLDRNSSDNDPVLEPNRINGGLVVQSSRSSLSAALDTFRVSFNGDEEQLMKECKLWPRKYLEKIEFNPAEPLFLYQLVTLVHLISKSSQNYSFAAENCYWFAGLIWECMRDLRPLAKYDDRLVNERNRFAMLRVAPEPGEKIEMCKHFKQVMQTVEERLAKSRQQWRTVQVLLGGLETAPQNEVRKSGDSE